MLLMAGSDIRATGGSLDNALSQPSSRFLSTVSGGTAQ